MAGSPADAPLARALALARRAWGDTHPNPMVGAVITEAGAVVAGGWHARAGEPHAEVAALRALGRPPGAGAALHVTLEPCSTHGRTPPCVDAILASGIRRVEVGTLDPNPLHAGRGIRLLREAGVEVTLADGAAELACRELNFLFNHWITRRRTLLALKVARDAAGRTVPIPGRRWITGEAARADVMRWRRLFPCVAVGAGTVLADDPALTARLPEGEVSPLRLILDRSGRLEGREGLALLRDRHRSRTLVALDPSRCTPSYREWLGRKGIVRWEIDTADFLAGVIERASREGILGILVEPGPSLGRALLASGRLDRAWVYTAPTGSADPASPAWLADPLPILGQPIVFPDGETLVQGPWTGAA
jgi:diaminohydroxyphosphoribosylaminopyrimidine deaminase / 5-amino-6-(5-phosphoribosylamino)uracil reductase